MFYICTMLLWFLIGGKVLFMLFEHKHFMFNPFVLNGEQQWFVAVSNLCCYKTIRRLRAFSVML